MIAPTRELAAAVFDAVERHHRAAGREVWPTPRIRDFSSWLREHHERRLVAGTASARCLEDAEERLLWRQIVAADGKEADLLDPDGAADAARRARRAMREHAIPAEALAAASTEEAALLRGWIGAFERRCRELGCIVADDLLASFPVAPEPVVRLASPAWRPAARRWADREARATIEPLRTVRAAAWRCHAADAAAELASSAEWLRTQLARTPGFRAWVLIPDLASRRDEVADAFDAALAPQRFVLDSGEGIAPYAIAGGSPLADYPQVAAALELVALAQITVPFERFSALLRAPGLQPDAGAASVAARVDVELRGAAPVEASLRGWLELAERARQRAALPPCTALARLGAALEPLEQARGAQPMSRWVALWVRAFDAAPWADRDRWSSAEYQSVERFRELLAQLATADSLIGSQGAAAAAGSLRKAARDAAFQPQTGIPPVWITGTPADPWLTYDALWIGGLAADSWPPPVEPLPLLPVELQRRYGVESASSAARLAASRELMGCWAARAPLAVFSLADRDEAGTAAFSPLLPEGLPALAADAPGEPRQWRAQRRSAPALEPFADERAPPFAAGEATRGVGTLRAQSMCAFRGFAHSRLRCEPLGRPAAGFDAIERGIMVHAALERVWADLGARAALASLAEAARSRLIAQVAAGAVAAARQRRDPGERWCRRERERLGRLLERWLELECRRTEFSVERLEQGRQIARHAGLEFACRIDRVDRLADGARVLIDYKSGAVSADWRGERPQNPQLPMYAALAGEGLVAVAYAQVSAAECRFVAETERADALFAGGRRSSLEGARDLGELLGRWRDRLDRIAAEFRDGRAAVDPAPRACETCGFQALCRVRAGGDPGDA